MAEPIRGSAKRIVISVDADLYRRVHEAATKRGMTTRAYLLEIVEQQLQRDLDVGADRALAMDVSADPVLAELWDNPRDAAYDRL
jgi:hypothetical protein